MPIRPSLEHAPTLSQDLGAATPVTDLELRVIEGPNAGVSFPLGASRVQRLLIGTSLACQVRLSDRHVSRRHAAIEQRNDRLHITDLESTNGTFVNDVPVTGAFLEVGGSIRMGVTRLQVLDTGAPVELSLSPDGNFGRMVGRSSVMRRLYPICARLAASDVPVIVEGETGTGKEVLAEAFHEQGLRADGPYIVFDCTAVPANLVESELFGHEKGSFTGAVAARAGVFEQADGGTLLLDEIGDLDLALQPKLLRAIERSEFRRVGGSKTIRVNVRILAATRRDLDREVEAGRFRDDLFHRLSVARIELPPLRKRSGDVELLALHFMASIGADPSTLPAEVLARWVKAPWSGNVRELRNAVLRQSVLGHHAQAAAREPRTLASDDFLEVAAASGDPLPIARDRVVAEFERRYLERVLAQHGGDTKKAAIAAGVARRYLQLLVARRAQQ